MTLDGGLGISNQSLHQVSVKSRPSCEEVDVYHLKPSGFALTKFGCMEVYHEVLFLGEVIDAIGL